MQFTINVWKVSVWRQVEILEILYIHVDVHVDHICIKSITRIQTNVCSWQTFVQSISSHTRHKHFPSPPHHAGQQVMVACNLSLARLSQHSVPLSTILARGSRDWALFWPEVAVAPASRVSTRLASASSSATCGAPLHHMLALSISWGGSVPFMTCGDRSLIISLDHCVTALTGSVALAVRRGRSPLHDWF